MPRCNPSTSTSSYSRQKNSAAAAHKSPTHLPHLQNLSSHLRDISRKFLQYSQIRFSLVQLLAKFADFATFSLAIRPWKFRDAHAAFKLRRRLFVSFDIKK